LICHFKIDKHDKIWFLWCSSVRTTHQHNLKDKNKKSNAPLELNSNINIPENVRSGLTVASMKPKTMRKDIKCQNCDACLEYDRIVKIP